MDRIYRIYRIYRINRITAEHVFFLIL